MALNDMQFTMQLSFIIADIETRKTSLKLYCLPIASLYGMIVFSSMRS